MFINHQSFEMILLIYDTLSSFMNCFMHSLVSKNITYLYLQGAGSSQVSRTAGLPLSDFLMQLEDYSPTVSIT